MPDRPEHARSRTVGIAIAIALVAAAVFGVGWAVGRSAGPDDAAIAAAHEESMHTAYEKARAVAVKAGIERGRAAGAKRGRDAGFRTGVGEGYADGAETASDAAAFIEMKQATQPDTGLVGAEAPLAGAGGVLVVGDSLEVLTSPYLQEHLPRVPLTINAEGGYSSLQIFELFKESFDPSQSVIVFDAGTNDNPGLPEILAGRLEAVADIVGDRCMVVPTIHGLPVDGVDDTGKNRAVARFAASRPGTQVPDWAGAVASHPELMQPDNLHPIPEGADFRAQLIAEGVEGCLSSAAPLFGG